MTKGKLTALLLFLQLISLDDDRAHAQLSSAAKQPVNRRLDKFRGLSGPDQVHMFFKEAFSKGWFWKQFTALPYDLRFEEEILVSSADPTINAPLTAEAMSGDNRPQASYAVYLICLRARFVPRSEFLIRGVVATYPWSEPEKTKGLISPFSPNWDRVGTEAKEAVMEALKSPNMARRAIAKLYSGELGKELGSVPTSELADRWRAAAAKLPHPTLYQSDASETASVIGRALVYRGLDAAVAVSSMLAKENEPWAVEDEIGTIAGIDSSTVRLRASPQGRDAIATIERIFATRKKWFIQENDHYREEYRQTLEDRFLKDEFDCNLNSALQMTALAFDQFYSEHMTYPSPYGGSTRFCNRELMTKLISYLTETDPTFPSWEFPTGSYYDVLHPRFAAKMARYHEVWIRMNSPRALPAVP